MAHLSHEEKMEYTDLFLKVNEQYGKGDGALTVGEFEQFLILCGFRLPREIVAEKFTENDKDGNWKITLDEFLARMPNIIPSGSALSVAARIRRKYNEFDITDDGYISFEELKQTMSKEGVKDEELLRRFMKEWDKDGDGRMNFEEFLVMYIKTVLLEEQLMGSDGEGEKLVENMTQLILACDKMRRLCKERQLIMAGVVTVDDVKALMSEVKLQLSEKQLEDCIKELGGGESGKVNFEEFICKYESIITLAHDNAENVAAEAKRSEKKDKIETKKEGDQTLKGDNDRVDKSVVNKDIKDVSHPEPEDNVKEMMDNLQKITL